MLLLLFLLALAPSAATHRQFDWHDCTTQACYVPDSCRVAGGSEAKLVQVAGAKDVASQHDCPFVMTIRPFLLSQWVVQLRLKQKKRIKEKKIRLTYSVNDTVTECLGHANGSITVTGENRTFDVHADSYFTRTRMYCLYTVSSASGDHLDTRGFDVIYTNGDDKKTLKLDSLGDLKDYVSCDVSKVKLSELDTGDGTARAPVDVTRLQLACPRGGAPWKMKVVLAGKLVTVKSAVCSPASLGYWIEVEDDQKVYYEEQFEAVCVASPGCSSCPAPLHSPCPHCAAVGHEIDKGSQCARLTCPGLSATPENPNKFYIGGRDFVGEPVCGPKGDGKEFGWSIKDALNQTVDFQAASCVKQVSCHSAAFLRLGCADAEQCAKPVAVDFDEGEGMVCQEGLLMRFRSTDDAEWTLAHDLLCDAKTGIWGAGIGDAESKALAHNSTVECVAQPNQFLFYGTIAVTIGVILVYATFLPHYLLTRKSDAEFDKNQLELSKAFAKIKEYPRSPDKSEKERSRQSEVKDEIGKPIVDTRIYPDELTVKRRKKKKKEKKEEGPPEFLRPREKEEEEGRFCKSIKEAGKEGWEKWIAKTGGIVREKKPREEVLRLRAEKKAARERRIEEEKQRRAEEEKAKISLQSAPPPSSPPKKSVVKSAGLATDQYLMKMDLAKKKKDAEERMVVIGDVAPPATDAAPKKKYTKHSKGAPRDEEIRFDPPTTSKDTASVLHLANSARKERSRREEFVTAQETSHNETDAREKTDAGPAVRTDDRAISSKMGPPAVIAQPHSSQKEESHLADVAVEGTEDEMRKRKKRAGKKTKKTSKSGAETLPKTITAVDNEPTVDVDRNSKKEKEKGVRSTPLLTSPSPLTPTSAASSTPTGETRRKRKKQKCLESKGVPVGLAKHLEKKGSRTPSPRNDDGSKENQ